MQEKIIIRVRYWLENPRDLNQNSGFYNRIKVKFNSSASFIVTSNTGEKYRLTCFYHHFVVVFLSCDFLILMSDLFLWTLRIWISVTSSDLRICLDKQLLLPICIHTCFEHSKVMLPANNFKILTWLTSLSNLQTQNWNATY